jgi:hypothetical protein
LVEKLVLETSQCEFESHLRHFIYYVNIGNKYMSIEEVLVHARDVLKLDAYLLEFLEQDLYENDELYKSLVD